MRWSARVRQIGKIRVEGGHHPPEARTLSKVGPLVLVECEVQAARILRDRETISGSAYSEHFLVAHLEQGTARGSAGGQLINLRKGDIGVFRLSECASLDLRRCSLLCVLVPREMLAAGGTRVLREGQLPCRMLSKHLHSQAFRGPAPISESEAHARAIATTSLLQLCLDFTTETGHDAASDGLRTAVLKYIDDNLDEADLRPAALCAKFKVSRTWLYETFSSYGGITRYVRDKRLDAAFGDLCSGGRHRIIDVAYRHGFPSERQFQRAFLARFGMQPRAVRDRRKEGFAAETVADSAVGA